MRKLDRRHFLAASALGVLTAGSTAKAGTTGAKTMTETPISYALTRPAYVGHSHLAVSDLPMVSAYYQKVLGLSVLEKNATGEVLGVGQQPLLSLTTGGDIRQAPRNAAGLFHTAFLMPNRTELGRWLRHAAHSNVRLDGASDHLVSEAIYLTDPEGNGIEVYADRPHDQWKYHQDGMVEMATLGLDLQALYDGAPADAWTGMVEGSAIGHIHLQVGDVPKANAFYQDVLGLKIMATYPGASFFGSGQYHHHVAANVWNSRGAQARTGSMSGLSDYTLHFNDTAALDTAVAALEALEIPTSRDAGVVSLKDPWGIGLKLTA